jgi:imidazolonepropionase-like amidohydrolase
MTAEPMSIERGLLNYGLKQTPRGGRAIRAGRLFDSDGGRILNDQIILINGDMITAVGPANLVQIPPGAEVIDLSNATVMPGLIDAHVHIMDSITMRMPNEASLFARAVPLALQHLQGGYTTLVDMGSGDSWAPIEYRNAVNRGWIPGPDLENENPTTSYTGVGQGGGNMHTGDMRRTEGQHSRIELTEKAFKRLRAAGIKQVFGSGDYGPLGRVPGQQSMQFQIFVKWGMTPIEALQTATVNAAAFLNDYLSPRVGRIKAGTFADIIAVPGDPLADMKLMMNVPFVMKGGVIFRDDTKTAKASN